MALPFQMAICTCGAGVLLAFPLVFHLPTVEYFNEHFVTAEHPLAKDLETALEVGAWSWNWMVRTLHMNKMILYHVEWNASQRVWLPKNNVKTVACSHALFSRL